jgi:transposase, IS5 family
MAGVLPDCPYMQFFIGLNNFTDYTPFDASTMTYFRKRLTPEILAEINQLIVEASKDDDDHHDDNASGDTGTPNESKPESKNDGTLILDATCAPADVHFPTDVALLNDSRVKLEEMIDHLHEGSNEKKPRIYRQKARTLYLRFARNRRPRYKQIRRAIREQLGFVRRDIELVREFLSASSSQLTPRQMQYWQTIQDVYRQQQEMYQEKKHKVEDRIVSIHQPWVRPIVRGKATADVEFGAKISVSLVNGYAMIEQLDWNVLQ